MFLTEKQDEAIKARVSAYRRKQRKFTNKTDATSPTAMIESIFIMAVIDAKEQRDVVIINLPGAFLFAWNDEK